MAKIYYEKDADLALLKDKLIGIVGYGSQGHAHAQNLRDSGLKVIVAEAKGTEGHRAAKKAGFDVFDAAEVSKKADVVMMLVPDQLQAKVKPDEIRVIVINHLKDFALPLVEKRFRWQASLFDDSVKTRVTRVT